MKFYKVVREAHDRKTFFDSYPGELLTERERRIKFPTLSDKCFDVVEVSKKATYWFFGCRFPVAD
jgi:hypothetical protein